MIKKITSKLELLSPGDSFFSLHRAPHKSYKAMIQALSLGAKYVFSYHSVEHHQHRRIAPCPKAKFELIRSFYGKNLAELDGLRRIGITGTNGKTSTAILLQEMLSHSGVSCASLGTLGLKIPNYIKAISFSLTTPDIIDFYWAQFFIKELGMQGLILEVSSHALSQQRIYGTTFEAVLATSVSCDDHRDYHRTNIHYLQSKARLFNEYHSDYKILPHNSLLIPHLIKRQGLSLVPRSKLGMAKSLIHAFHLPHLDLIHRYLRCARLHPRLSDDQLVKNTKVPGRFEAYRTPAGTEVVIDYAHTPMALEYVLSLLKDYYLLKEIWLVFGCGGDRDKQKRSQMVQVGLNYAKRLIITEDNNRSEAFDTIAGDMLAQVDGSEREIIDVIEKREQALSYVFEKVPKDAVVLVAGKGHETYTDLRFNESNNTDQKQVGCYAVPIS